MKTVFAFWFSLFLLLSPAGKVSAQQNDFVQTVGNDFGFFIKSGEHIVTQPFSGNSQFWRDASLTLAGTVALFFADNTLRDFSIRNQSTTADRIFSFDKFYGNIYSVALSSFIYGAGLVTHQDKLRITGLKAVTAIFYSTAFTYLLKTGIGRHRPYLENGNATFSPFSIDNDFNSLPSGHTTVAFALSTVLADAVDNTALKILFYTTAGLTAASRIYHDQHWLSDVFLGAVIGYSTAKAVDEFGKQKGKTFLSLTFGKNSIGVIWTF